MSVPGALGDGTNWPHERLSIPSLTLRVLTPAWRCAGLWAANEEGGMIGAPHVTLYW